MVSGVGRAKTRRKTEGAISTLRVRGRDWKILGLRKGVVRSLVVEVGEEAYAFPLAHIERMCDLAPDDIVQLEGRQHFWHEGRHVGLVAASQLLQRPAGQSPSDTLKVVVIRERDAVYGIAVERFIGERTLVVLPLDDRLE